MPKPVGMLVCLNLMGTYAQLDFCHTVITGFPQALDGQEVAIESGLCGFSLTVVIIPGFAG
jgi:hypothetical protein